MAPQAAVVAWFCWFQVVWGLTKLPWHFGMAEALQLPNAYRPHPDGKSGGSCPLMISPMLRTGGWQRSPPAWIGYHTIFAMGMEAVFALTLQDHLALSDARWPLAGLLAMQLPFFAMFFRNLGKLPKTAASVAIAGIAVPYSVGVLVYLCAIDETAATAAVEGAPFYCLLGLWQIAPLIDVATSLNAIRTRKPCSHTSDADQAVWQRFVIWSAFGGNGVAPGGAGPAAENATALQQAGHATWEDIMQVVEEASSFEELTTLLADKDSVLTRVGRKEVGPVKQLAP
jgi:hypothetical protein